MTLIDITHFPPGGYQYRQPQIPWVAPNDLAHQGLEAVARALCAVRRNNPNLGLDTSFESCLRDVMDYQCARFQHDPALLKKFCGEENSAVTQAFIAQQRTGCATCGGSR